MHHAAFRLLPALLLVPLLAGRGLAAPADDPVDIAKRHFRSGSILYDAQDYDGALREFTAAQKAKPMPGFSYNIARCHDRLDHYDEAADAYARYLEEEPNAADAGTIQARIEVLRKKAEAAGVVKKAAGPAAPTERERKRDLLVAASVGGGAVLLIAAGAALAGSVKPELDELNKTCPYPCPEEKWGGLKARADAGYAMLALGSAALVADGVLWALFFRRHGLPGARKVTLLPTGGPDGVGLAAAGAF